MPIQQSMFIPEIANLLMGLDYDMAMNEASSHDNVYSEHPIEDPQRSFLMDHNRERPTQLKITINVSSNPITGPTGIQRITLFYEKMLYAKSLQSVSVNSFFNVYTGVKVHQNMAIKSIRMSRSNEKANEAKFEINLHEFRFATYPKFTSDIYFMKANSGRYNNNAEEVVTDQDYMITQSTTTKQKAKTAIPKSPQLSQILKASEGLF